MRLPTSILSLLLGLICFRNSVSQVARPERNEASTAPSAKQSLRVFLQSYLAGSLPRHDKDTQYREAFVDLNADGRPEVIVYVTGSVWCGSGGCLTLILARAGSSYRVVSRITITRPPIYVLPHTSNGWHDIAVRVQGGSTQPGYEAELRFDGNTYPGNPSVPPARRLNGTVSGDLILTASGEREPLY